jgi:PPOX class probable F420-dependent enzyme
MELSEELKDVLDSKAFAHVATIDPDGTPQVSVMWMLRDGDRILLNTAEGRRKWRNLSRDPRLGISISPLDRPYVNFSIQGRVVDARTSDGRAVIDAMSSKYRGVDEYQGMSPGMVRVTFEIEVTRVARYP